MLTNVLRTFVSMTHFDLLGDLLGEYSDDSKGLQKLHPKYDSLILYIIYGSDKQSSLKL